MWAGTPTLTNLSGWIPGPEVTAPQSGLLHLLATRMARVALTAALNSSRTDQTVANPGGLRPSPSRWRGARQVASGNAAAHPVRPFAISAAQVGCAVSPAAQGSKPSTGRNRATMGLVPGEDGRSVTFSSCGVSREALG